MSKTNAKAAKTEPVSPALIVFGLSEIGKPRAGTFIKTEIETATKAASAMRLAVLRVSDDPTRELAALLPPGSAQANGRGFIPFIRENLFKQIQQLAGAQEVRTYDNERKNASLSEFAGDDRKSSAAFRLPSNWDDITVGDLVLAQDVDPKDGWWQAVITQKNGDMYSVRWQQAKSRRVVVKHKYNLALMWPGKPIATSPDPKKLSAAVVSANWETIGANQLVLAKEEGPMEQWWEATTIEAQDDRFILKWRDYSHLPSFVRPRAVLALIYPVPSGPKAKASASS